MAFVAKHNAQISASDLVDQSPILQPPVPQASISAEITLPDKAREDDNPSLGCAVSALDLDAATPKTSAKHANHARGLWATIAVYLGLFTGLSGVALLLCMPQLMIAAVITYATGLTVMLGGIWGCSAKVPASRSDDFDKAGISGSPASPYSGEGVPYG